MQIHTRKSWGARRARPNRARQNAAAVRELFVHWPGGVPRSWANVNTPAEERATMRNIQDFHMGPERGWADFAYSYAIFPSGRVYRGRGIDYVPAAQEGHNTGTVAVCVFIGPDDAVTATIENSIAALRKHVARVSGNHVRLRPHRAVVQTDCPGPKLTALVGRMQ